MNNEQVKQVVDALDGIRETIEFQSNHLIEALKSNTEVLREIAVGVSTLR